MEMNRPDYKSKSAAIEAPSKPVSVGNSLRAARILFHFPRNPFILLADPERGGLAMAEGAMRSSPEQGERN
jgi:hypothetical protein